jgi:hypothetical protein
MTTPYESQYRTEFRSISFGTEQELSGVFIDMPRPNLPDIIAVVSKGGNVLVEITKDLAVPQYSSRHVVELRTTPTELSDDSGWFDRLQALWVAVSYVESTRTAPLQGDEYEGYITTVHVGGASFTGGKAVPGGNQATAGIPVNELGSGMSDEELVGGKLHGHLQLPWYVHSFTDNASIRAKEREERIAFALIMSAILKLANIWESDEEYVGKVNLLDIKNAWGVRPRTSPAKLFGVYDTDDELEDAVIDFQLPDKQPDDWGRLALKVPSLEIWQKARQHIVEGRPMGGHQAPDVVIEKVQGQPERALLFEHRTVGAAEFRGRFWTPQATFLTPYAET